MSQMPWHMVGFTFPTAPMSWRVASGHCVGHAWDWDGDPGFDISKGVKADRGAGSGVWCQCSDSHHMGSATACLAMGPLHFPSPPHPAPPLPPSAISGSSLAGAGTPSQLPG